MSYKKLEVWQLARDVVIEIHQMTLQELPRFELYEEGSQIRRSSKSVKSNIVEGYGRRRHKQDYIRFLDFAYASCLETTDHLENLVETGSLTNESLSASLSEKMDKLGRKLNRFIQSVERQHNVVKEHSPVYLRGDIQKSKIENPIATIKDPNSKIEDQKSQIENRSQ